MTRTPHRSASAVDGLVVASYGLHHVVETDRGVRFRCTARSKLGPIVCGDRVSMLSDGSQSGVIESIAPRRTLLSRPDARGKLKPVAANIDQLVIVLAPGVQTGQPALDGYTLDRYLVAAEVSDIRPLIVVNKVDLANPAVRAELTNALGLYAQMDYPTCLTSPKSGEGMAGLEAHLRTHTSVFVGQSGVGKSSLIDHFLPDAGLRIGAVSATTGLGRHTTTAAALYQLACGGNLVDSPGVREFGLWNIPQPQVAAAFVDLRASALHCRFNNCRHLDEPGCAVRSAVDDGTIAQRRYDNYRRIIESLAQPR